MLKRAENQSEKIKYVFLFTAYLSPQALCPKLYHCLLFHETELPGSRSAVASSVLLIPALAHAFQLLIVFRPVSNVVFSCAVFHA